MKTFKALLLVWISFTFIISCSSNSPNESTDTTYGKFSLAFDKSNIPENVASVKATLTKQGYDPIIASLSLLDSNSAEIFINEIPVGQWHLLVEAIDEQDVLLYSGETYITIVDGEILTVNLTLQPTGNGTGSLYLYVDWGDNSWVDYEGNPIFSSDNNLYAPYGYTHSFVIYDDNIYKMWFSGLANSSVTYVFFATSSDGLSWEKNSHNPVIIPSGNGSWNSGRISAGPVIKDSTQYKMYYHTFANENDIWHIGLATSTDGIAWQKHPVPSLSGDINRSRVVASHIEKIGSIYFMYYTSWDQPFNYDIRLATSIDGIDWEKYGNEPILSATEDWEGNGVLYPTVIKENGVFKMIYQNGLSNNTSFGFAYSTDGIHWNKDSNNPFLNTGDIATDIDKIVYPNFIKTENDYRIYYSSFTNSKSSINLARKFIY
jgi:predicted GH43/DUF377 family glycosyl hydrolase